MGLPDGGLMTFFFGAAVAFVSRIKLLNKIVCDDDVLLVFNFESFVFDFGGIFRNQVVMDQTTRTRPTVVPVAIRHFRRPGSRTRTEYNSESGLIAQHGRWIFWTSKALTTWESPPLENRCEIAKKSPHSGQGERLLLAMNWSRCEETL